MHKQLVILRVVIMSVVILGLLLAACQVSPTPVPTPGGPAAAPTSPPPKAIGELVIAVDSFGWETLDPILGNPGSKLHLTLMYDYLVGIDRTGAKLDPATGIAKRWEESADGLTWTFWVRDGVKFHNGDDLTAEDVKFSLERSTSEKSVAANAPGLRSNILSIDIEDPYRVKIRLKERSWTLAYWLSPLLSANEGMIYPKGYLTQKGDEYFAEHPIGSGPYRFEKWVSGNLITYKAVENHWLVGTPKYDRITFKLVPEESSRIAMLERGEAHLVTGVSPLKSKGLKDKFQVLVKEGSNISSVFFMQQWTDRNPLGNEKVREALGLALNKQEMLENILYGAGSLTGAFPVPSWSPAYLPLDPVPYDPEKAKRLLKEAGYGPGDITLNIYLYGLAGFVEQQKLSTEAAVAYWEAIGVKSKIIALDYVAFSPLWQGKGKGLENPAVTVGHPFGARLMPPFQLFWHGKGPYAALKDPQVDALIEALEATSDVKTYTPAAQAVTRYLREHFLVIPLFELGQTVATSKAIPPWQLGMRSFDYNWLDLYGR